MGGDGAVSQGARRERRVLFVHQHKEPRTFEEIDWRLLASNYSARKLGYPYGRRGLPGLFLRLLWADVAVSWFADRHSYYTVQACRLLNKKSVVIAGGYDTAYAPEIGYGIAFRRPGAKDMVAKTLSLCDSIVVNSRFAQSEVMRNFGVDRAKLHLVYHGLDSKWFKPSPKMPKEELVLTAGGVKSTTLRRKGLETFVQAARYLPQYRFVLAGGWFDNTVEDLRMIAPSNVEFVGHKGPEEILELFQRAKVYVQVSRYETFGMALAEAMLCQCVPVVTEAGSIPEVVGKCGFYAPPDDPPATAAAIEKAMKAPAEVGIAARERIRMNFPLEKREQGLVEVIENLFRVNDQR